MPQTHDSKPVVLVKGPLIVSVESLFWHVQRYPKRRLVALRQPLSEPARPREVEDPYRKGHGRAFRLPLTRWALVLGWWEPEGEPVLEEEQSSRLLEAVEGTMIQGVTAYDIAGWKGGLDPLWRRVAAFCRALLSKATRPTQEPAYADSVPWPGTFTDADDRELARGAFSYEDARIIDFEETRTDGLA